MVSSLLTSFLLFDLGSWFGFALAKFFPTGQNKSVLRKGIDRKTSLPFIDERMEQETLHATQSQRRLARGIASAIRAFANTHLFEFIVLDQLNRNWPGKKSLNPEVKLFV